MSQFSLWSFALGLMLAGSSEAHEWYDRSCCSGEDCAPIPADSVSMTDEGLHVILKYGDHPLVPEGVTVDQVIPYDKMKQSRDGVFHACLRSYTSHLGGGNTSSIPSIRCLYGGGLM